MSDACTHNLETLKRAIDLDDTRIIEKEYGKVLEDLQRLFKDFKEKHVAGDWIEINVTDFEEELENKIFGKKK